MKHHSICHLIVVAAAAANCGVAGSADIVTRPFITRTKQTPSATKTTALKRKTFFQRGGGGDDGDNNDSIGPFQKDDIAKLATLLHTANAAFISLSPKNAAKLYGMEETTPLVQWLFEAGGATLGVIAVQSWCLFFGETDIHTAVGAGCLPGIIFDLAYLLNERPAELGKPAFGHFVTLAFKMFLAYALLTETSYADVAMTGITIWRLANGLLMGLVPATGARAWGVEGDQTVTFLLKCVGYYLTSAGVYTGALAMKQDKRKSFGYAWLVPLILLISVNFVTMEVDQLNMDKNIQYLWLVICALVAGTLAI